MLRIPLCASILTILVATLSYAQDGHDKLNPTNGLYPQSPNVSSLEKFAQIPVSKYTGIPNITIPLLSIQGQKLNLPITLKYHASGIKAAEVASWVGLGWALDAGAVISRSVNGKPDESQYGYWETPPIPTNPNTDKAYLWDVVVLDIHDTKPDMFTLALPTGNSLQFMIKKDGSVIQFPYSTTKIEYNRLGTGELTSFTVTEATGLIYHFAAVEYTETQTGDDVLSFPSAWYISEIRLPDSNEKIQFAYETEPYTASVVEQYTDFYDGAGAASQNGNPFCSVPTASSTQTSVYIDALRLQSISNAFTQETISFFTSVRSDVSALRKLDSVSYSTAGQIIGKWLFNYGAFAGGTGRLQLLSVVEKNGQNETKEPYTFSYNAGSLPAYSTKSIDHWGYYNGANNTTILPAYTFNVAPSPIVWPGANREVDQSQNGDLLKIGMLNKITYPTKGETTFEYEPNDYGYTNAGAENFIIYKNKNQSLSVNGIQNQSFVFTPNYQGLTKLTLRSRCQSCAPNTLPTDYVVEAKIMNGSSQVGNLVHSRPTTTEIWIQTNANTPYTVVLENYDGSLIDATATISWSDTAMTSNDPALQPKKKRVGGVRIKKITNFDGLDISKNVVRSFLYNIEGETDRSSGVLLDDPSFKYIKPYTTEQLSPCNPSSPTNWMCVARCTFLKRGASFAKHQMESGMPIVYKEVVETVANGEIGSTRTKFNTGNLSDPENYSPYPVAVPDDYKSGTVKEEKTYSSTGKLIAYTKNMYVEGLSKSAIASFAAVVRLYKHVNPQTDTEYDSKVSVFESKAYNLQSVEQTVYDAFGANGITTVIQYAYHPNHLNVSEVTTTNSDGSQQFNRIKYVGDYTGATATNASVAIQNALSQNKQILPIEEMVYIKKNGQQEALVNGVIRQYRTLGSGMVVLDSIFKLETSIPIINYSPSSVNNQAFVFDRALYKLYGSVLSYDVNGNITSFSKEKDIPQSFIWGHNNTRVLATAVNAYSSEIGYVGFELGAESNWVINPSAQYTQGYMGDRALTSNIEFPVGNAFVVERQTSKFKLSAWVRNLSGQAAYLVLNTRQNGSNTAPIFPGNGNIQTAILPNTQWQLIETEIDLNTIRQMGGVPLSTQLWIHAYIWNPNFCNLEIDAIRFAPSDAFMQTYDYNRYTKQLTTAASINNIFTKFNYDNFGRLSFIQDYQNNIVKAFQYYYKGNSAIPNYLKIINVKLAGKTTLASLAGLTKNEISETFTYFDGLGRLIQSVEKQSTPLGDDLAVPSEYDIFGRTPKKFLPYLRNTQNGQYQAISPTTTGGDYINYYTQSVDAVAKTNFPWIPTRWEDNPLQRVVEEGNVGDYWQIGLQATTKAVYTSNQFNEVLNLFSQSSAAVYYPAQTLNKTEITNPSGSKVITYTDKAQRVILTKIQQDTVWAYTYNIYDDFGNVNVVVPPLAYEKMVSTGNYNWQQPAIANLIYEYRRDSKNNLIYRKEPSKGFEEFVYDALGRVILSQDAKLRQALKWKYNKYDQYGRLVYMGLLESQNNRIQWQGLADNQQNVFESPTNSVWGYSNIVVPVLPQNALPHVIKYYDNYDFDRNGQIDAANQIEPMSSFDSRFQNLLPFSRVIGKLTGEKVLILDGFSQYLDALLFYTDKDSILQLQRKNHLGGKDITTHLYNFEGLESTKIQTHKNSTAYTHYVVESTEYDHRNRIIKVWHSKNGSTPIKLKELTYNELGQLIRKNLHSSGTAAMNLQSINYGYTAQGQLKYINDINYLQTTDKATAAAARYSGLATQMNQWVRDCARSLFVSSATVTINSTTYNAIDDIAEYDYQIAELDKWYSQVTNPSNLDANGLARWNSYGSIRAALNANLDQALAALAEQIGGGTISLPSSGLTQLRACVVAKARSTYRNQYMVTHTTPQSESSNDLFAMYFNYNTAGNIQNMQWRVSGASYRSIYDVTYDGLNRMTNANYQEFVEGSYAGPQFQKIGLYNENSIQYDIAGNIKGLKRRSWTSVVPAGLDIDNLSYSYSGHQLRTISDATTQTLGFQDGFVDTLEYAYDENGNMVMDKNKGISIAYNHMNLPISVTWANIPNQRLEYVYDAAGNKLTQRSITTTNSIATRDYLGNIEYVDGVIQFIGHSEGRITLQPNVNGGYNALYEYTISDQANNGRVYFADINNDGILQPATELLQQQHYYPFGLSMIGEWQARQSVPPATYQYNRYQYNGIESIGDFGLGVDMATSRVLDPAIGRWWSIDPLANQMPTWSPYSNNFNNPINFADLDGEWPYPIWVRSFAPFRHFGGNFEGDATKRVKRHFSTELGRGEIGVGGEHGTVTSRLQHRFFVDPTAGTVTGSGAWCHSSFNPSIAYFGRKTANATGSINVLDARKDHSGQNATINFMASMAAANPLVPFSPDINVYTYFSITENQTAGTLTIKATQSGDAFPAAETMIGDKSGNRILIGVSPAVGGVTRLIANNMRPMMSTEIIIHLDQNGNFIGVSQKGKRYSVQEWNDLMRRAPTTR